MKSLTPSPHLVSLMLALGCACLAFSPHVLSGQEVKAEAQKDLTQEKHERTRKQAVTGLLLLSSGLFVCIVGLSVVWYVKRAGTESSRGVAKSAKREMDSLLQLAKSSEERSKELEIEKAVRKRIEEDLQFNQQMLSRAVDEKIQLGRDLHDGMIQSLYSAGLTLEAAKTQIDAEPQQAAQKVEKTIDLLNATIAEVRAFIKGLSPEALRASGFKFALTSLADELRAGRDVAYDLRIDDQAASKLSIEQTREILQILREAISNALRHGQAGSIALYFGIEGDDLALIIRDNGRGFNPSANPDSGHGLRNMEARVHRLGGRWDLRAREGEGVVIRLFFPIVESKQS